MTNLIGWIIGIAVIYFIFSAFGGFGKYEGENAEYWFNAYDAQSGEVEELNSKVEEYQSTLEDANSNIEQANSNIQNAKGYAWESYEEMGDALDGLNTVYTVDDPY